MALIPSKEENPLSIESSLLSRQKSTQSKKSRSWKYILFIPLFFLFIYLGIGATAALILTKPERYIYSAHVTDPSSLQLKYQDVTLNPRGENLKLSGWYFSKKNSSKAILMVHGKDNSRVGEFRGHALEIAAELYHHGYSILMIDLRGHGYSDDSRLSLGLKEKQDVLGAIDFLKEHESKNTKIGILAASMGAAASLFAMKEEPLIQAIIEDSGYADFSTVLSKNWQKSSHLPNFFLPISRLMVSLFFGYDPYKVKPLQTIPYMGLRPMLIIHGDADNTVPIEQAYLFKQAYPSAETLYVHNAKHVGSYEINPTQYMNTIFNFLDKNL